MKVKKLFLLGTVALLLVPNSVNAFSEKTITEYSNGIVKVIEGKVSEEDEILNRYSEDIEINGNKYIVSNVGREKTNENTKEESKSFTEILNINNEDKIREHFGDVYQYEDSDYAGTLKLSNVEVKTLNQGSYEEIDEKTIQFSGYSQNDLNDINKETTINGITYYLINVKWNIETSQNIDNQEVPQTYSGTMIYQTVLTRKNPDKYEVTATFTGEVDRKDFIYNYSIYYEPVKEKNKPVENEPETYDNSDEYRKIIISGIGIAGIILALLLNKNTKVYNKTDKGYKLIGRYNVNKAEDVINITNNYYKTKSNIYSIKLDEKTYKKLKDKTIYLQIKKYKKPVIVNKQYIEILM